MEINFDAIFNINVTNVFKEWFPGFRKMPKWNRACTRDKERVIKYNKSLNTLTHV